MTEKTARKVVVAEKPRLEQKDEGISILLATQKIKSVPLIFP